ncbi:hypothetical protein MHYP_G00330420 [Metynnis hypsauchen]
MPYFKSAPLKKSWKHLGVVWLGWSCIPPLKSNEACEWGPPAYWLSLLLNTNPPLRATCSPSEVNQSHYGASSVAHCFTGSMWKRSRSCCSLLALDLKLDLKLAAACELDKPAERGAAPTDNSPSAQLGGLRRFSLDAGSSSGGPWRGQERSCCRSSTKSKMGAGAPSLSEVDRAGTVMCSDED